MICHNRFHIYRYQIHEISVKKAEGIIPSAIILAREQRWKNWEQEFYDWIQYVSCLSMMQKVHYFGGGEV